jgi:hypothetical protein
MHRLRLLLLGFWLACGAACRREAVRPASAFEAGDPARVRQLLFGFHGVESRSSRARWTARSFGVALKPPSGSERTGANVWVRFYIPDSQIEALGPVTLRGSIDDYPLAPEIFSTGGVHEYVRYVPGEILDTNILPVSFYLDKFSPPGAVEARELGAVVLKVGVRAN